MTRTVFFMFILICLSCKQNKPRKEQALFETYCASCHIAPRIDELPKDIWKNAVLPDMAARMDIEELYHDPQDVVPGFRPKIKLRDWVALQNYIIELAPKKLRENPLKEQETLQLFESRSLAIDKENGALLTYLQFRDSDTTLLYGAIDGKLEALNLRTKAKKSVYKGSSALTWYNQYEQHEVFTEVGILDPSEQQKGKLSIGQGSSAFTIADAMHRPVHTLYEDLNGNGNPEFVVSEFGNDTGQLVLIEQIDSLQYEKTVLLKQPGCVRTLARDMDHDGNLDLIVMTTQGNESITILYQTGDLKFSAERPIEFSPVYGSSWFEVIDYNKDGHYDIVTVNGDNADKSYVHKPYHGMHIHLNKGDNSFYEAYFYPLNGATRVIANDFDQDGDMDFGLISTFPDYEKAASKSFVYLENLDAPDFEFGTKILPDPNIGRWFLMDTADFDADGDEDIVLGSFTYVFTPVPENLSKRWAKENVDILILENKLF